MRFVNNDFFLGKNYYLGRGFRMNNFASDKFLNPLHEHNNRIIAKANRLGRLFDRTHKTDKVSR